jgi:hypothetical protein
MTVNQGNPVVKKEPIDNSEKQGFKKKRATGAEKAGGKGNLFDKKNSIDEENSDRQFIENIFSKGGSMEEQKTNPEFKENYLDDETSGPGDQTTNNLDSGVLKGSKRKSISGTFRSLRSRLSTRRTSRKVRKDIRCIEFDGSSVDSPDTDCVILGAESVGYFDFNLKYFNSYFPGHRSFRQVKL